MMSRHISITKLYIYGGHYAKVPEFSTIDFGYHTYLTNVNDNNIVNFDPKEFNNKSICCPCIPSMQPPSLISMNLMSLQQQRENIDTDSQNKNIQLKDHRGHI